MRKITNGVLLLALITALFLSPLASKNPDGLNRVAQDYHFMERAEGKPLVSSPLKNYSIPNIKDQGLSTGIAGVIGTLMVLGLSMGIGKILQGKENA